MLREEFHRNLAIPYGDPIINGNSHVNLVRWVLQHLTRYLREISCEQDEGAVWSKLLLQDLEAARLDMQTSHRSKTLKAQFAHY